MDLDYLLDLDFSNKIESNPNVVDAKVCIVYQTPIIVSFSDGTDHEFIPTTFEDALAYTNFEAFKVMKGNGLIKKFKIAFKLEDESKIALDIYNSIESKTAKKAEFALDMIFNRDPATIIVSTYIAEGLELF